MIYKQFWNDLHHVAHHNVVITRYEEIFCIKMLKIFVNNQNSACEASITGPSVFDNVL